MSSDRDAHKASYGLFLGAGASAALAQFLLEEDIKLEGQACLLPTSTEFLNHVSEVIESSSVSSPASKLWEDLSTLGHDNIELLMRDIDSLEQGLGVISRLQSLAPGFGITQKMESRCQELRNLIHQEIQNCYSLPHGEAIDNLVASFFHPIVQGLDLVFDAPVNSDVIVITTNIDTVIERYARSASPCF